MGKEGGTKEEIRGAIVNKADVRIRSWNSGLNSQESSQGQKNNIVRMNSDHLYILNSILCLTINIL